MYWFSLLVFVLGDVYGLGVLDCVEELGEAGGGGLVGEVGHEAGVAGGQAGGFVGGEAEGGGGGGEGVDGLGGEAGEGVVEDLEQGHVDLAQEDGF